MHPTMTIKNWAHNWHWPSTHSMHDHLVNLMHDGRFWAVLAMIVLLGLFISLAVIFGGEGNSDLKYPFYNFPYYYIP